jgi:aminoglycoside phosphotransferase (APT) family kinase protein
VAFGEDTVLGIPFSVVDFVEGTVIRTTAQLHALPDADIERCAYGLIDVLARLHAIEPVAVGLSGFGRPRRYLARQVRRWHDQWTRVQTRPLADIDTLHAKLASACPAESGASIVHGDYRIDNAILDPDDPGTVRAIVDWELATLGDPLADLGFIWCTPTPRSRRCCLVRPRPPATGCPRPPISSSATRKSAGVTWAGSTSTWDWGISRSLLSPKASTPASGKA